MMSVINTFETVTSHEKDSSEKDIFIQIKDLNSIIFIIKIINKKYNINLNVPSKFKINISKIFNEEEIKILKHTNNIRVSINSLMTKDGDIYILIDEILNEETGYKYFSFNSDRKIVYNLNNPDYLYSINIKDLKFFEVYKFIDQVSRTNCTGSIWFDFEIKY